MKYINKIYVLLSFLTIGLFTACNTDQEGPTYNAQGVAFSSGALTSVVVSPNDPTFKVDVFRANANGAVSGNVTISSATYKDSKGNDVPLEGCTVSGYSFAEGETMTSITVNVEPLNIGIDLTLVLAINSEEIALGGASSTSIGVSKDYNWQSLGTGTFTDNFAIGHTYDVEILKAEGFDRYRVMEPYAESMINDDGENGNWVATSSAPYVDFWTVSGTKEVRFNAFFIGLNYQGLATNAIYAYHPAAFGISGAFNKWVDDKTIQLAPYYYIEALQGGFDYTAQNDIIIITLP